MLQGSKALRSWAQPELDSSGGAPHKLLCRGQSPARIVPRFWLAQFIANCRQNLGDGGVDQTRGAGLTGVIRHRYVQGREALVYSCQRWPFAQAC